MRGGILIGGALTLGFVLLAALSLVWTPYDIEILAISSKLQPPNPRIGWARITTGAISCR